MHYTNVTPEKYLTEKNIRYKKINGELNYCCPNGCDNDSRDDEAHGYMNAETGMFQCKKCLIAGGLNKFAGYFGDSVGSVIVAKQAIQKPKSTFNPKLVEICHRQITPKIVQYLNDRGITEAMIEENELGLFKSSDGKEFISIPVKNKEGENIYFKLRENPFLDSTGKKYRFYPFGSKSSLFGVEHFKNPASDVFVSEGELDCLILQSKGVTAVSSTAGCGTFKDKWIDEYFDKQKMEKINIVFDNDEEGQKGARMVAEKFAKKGFSVFIITLPEQIKSEKKGDITDYFTKFNGTMEELLSWAKPFEREEKSEDENREKEKEGEENEKKQIAILRKNILNNDNIFYFLDQFKESCIWVKVEEHHEVMKCESDRFKRWLHKKYFEITNDSPSSESIKKFTELIIALATFGKEKRELSVRIAKQGSTIWYDLGDYEWRAVRIDENGWQIIDNPPILFKRSVQDEQVLPEKGSSIKRLLDFININDPKQRVLFLVSVIVNFFPHVIRPLHVYYGVQGSTKSTTSQVVKSITDPTGTELLVLVSDQRELAQQLSHHYLLAFDNLSGLSSAVSDILCKAVTGAGLTKRKLYSDEENVQFKFRRALILNGVNLMVAKPDLLDRSLLFQFERMDDKERKSDEQFWDEFRTEKGKLLGAIFDVMSQAMKILPTIKLDKSPRMADFTRYGCAVAEVLGYGKDLFLDAYEENRKIQNKKAVEENPIAAAISIWMEQLVFDSWEGTATELLRELQKTAENEGIDVKSKKWPKDASALSRRINEVKVNLFLEGIEIEKTGQREWKICYVEECRKCRDAEENASNEAQNTDGNQNGTVVDNGIEDSGDIASELPF